MMRWLAARLAGDLRRRLGEGRVAKAFSRLPKSPPKATGEPENRALVRVYAVQAEAKAYPTLPAWVRQVDRHFRAAQEAGAELICFPELFGLLLFGLLPLVRLALWAFSKKGPAAFLPDAVSPASEGSVLGGPAPDGPTPHGPAPLLPRLLTPFAFLQERYTALLARFARRYGLYVACGTLLVPEEGKVYNRHLLLSPTGEVLGQADKLHPTQEERALGVSQGQEAVVVPTPIGNIALAVCMDATYFETFRIGKNLGADYAIVPIGDMAEFHPWLALRGAQVRSSETGLPAIKPALVSRPPFPIRFTGKAGIWFPLESGLHSVECGSFDTPGGVAATLDLDALRVSHPLMNRKNPAFDQKAIEALCKGEEPV